VKTWLYYTAIRRNDSDGLIRLGFLVDVAAVAGRVGGWEGLVRGFVHVVPGFGRIFHGGRAGVADVLEVGGVGGWLGHEGKLVWVGHVRNTSAPV